MLKGKKYFKSNANTCTTILARLAQTAVAWCDRLKSGLWMVCTLRASYGTFASKFYNRGADVICTWIVWCVCVWVAITSRENASRPTLFPKIPKKLSATLSHRWRAIASTYLQLAGRLQHALLNHNLYRVAARCGHSRGQGRRGPPYLIVFYTHSDAIMLKAAHP